MDNKGQVKIISAVIMGVLGIVFTLVLLSNVAIPQVFNPQAELNATVTNTTALIDLSEFIVTVAGFEFPVRSPLQLINSQFSEGIAVNATTAPLL